MPKAKAKQIVKNAKKVKKNVKKRSVARVAPVRPVQGLIRGLRGKQIILDTDLAVLYKVSTSAMNQAVKRNLKRFPSDFMFEITEQEAEILKSQIVISSWGGRRRSMPRAFTQEGVAMLSSVLRSSRAIQMNVLIMRAFVQLREIVAHNKEIAERVAKLEHTQSRTLSVMEELVIDIDRLANEVRGMKQQPPKPQRQIGFKASAD